MNVSFNCSDKLINVIDYITRNEIINAFDASDIKIMTKSKLVITIRYTINNDQINLLKKYCKQNEISFNFTFNPLSISYITLTDESTKTKNTPKSSSFINNVVMIIIFVLWLYYFLLE